MIMRPDKTWTVQYTENGTTTWEYVPGQSREQVRRVFHQQYPKRAIRSVVEAD
jgi:hypothetical protein